MINGFRTKGRTYGDLFAYPCRVDGVDAVIVFPLRSNHPQNIIEIISDINLRRMLNKGAGARVVVEA